VEVAKTKQDTNFLIFSSVTSSQIWLILLLDDLDKTEPKKPYESQSLRRIGAGKSREEIVGIEELIQKILDL
jgi:hypothetical protein